MFERNKWGQLVWVAEVDRFYHLRDQREAFAAADAAGRLAVHGTGTTYGPGDFTYPALRAQDKEACACRARAA